MALLYGRAGRLTAENGGFWPGQRVTNTTMSQAVGRNLEITGLQVWFEGPVSMSGINVSNNTFVGLGDDLVHISKVRKTPSWPESWANCSLL